MRASPPARLVEIGEPRLTRQAWPEPSDRRNRRRCLSNGPLSTSGYPSPIAPGRYSSVSTGRVGN